MGMRSSKSGMDRKKVDLPSILRYFPATFRKEAKEATIDDNNPWVETKGTEGRTQELRGF